MDDEDMDRNMQFVARSEDLRRATEQLVDRSADAARRLIATEPEPPPRAGRKGRALQS